MFTKEQLAEVGLTNVFNVLALDRKATRGLVISYLPGVQGRMAAWIVSIEGSGGGGLEQQRVSPDVEALVREVSSTHWEESLYRRRSFPVQRYGASSQTEARAVALERAFGFAFVTFGVRRVEWVQCPLPLGGGIRSYVLAADLEAVMPRVEALVAEGPVELETVAESVERFRLEVAGRVPEVSVVEFERHSIGSPASGEVRVSVGRHGFYPMDVLVISGSSGQLVVPVGAALQLADAIREADALWDRRPSEEGS